MVKVLEIPDKCPRCGESVEVDDYSVQNWMIVRCKGRDCDYWTQGPVREFE